MGSTGPGAVLSPGTRCPARRWDPISSLTWALLLMDTARDVAGAGVPRLCVGKHSSVLPLLPWEACFQLMGFTGICLPPRAGRKTSPVPLPTGKLWSGTPWGCISRWHLSLSLP